MRHPFQIFTAFFRELFLSKTASVRFPFYLDYAAKACMQGVQEAHLVSRHLNGALLLELFATGGDGACHPIPRGGMGWHGKLSKSLTMLPTLTTYSCLIQNT